MKIHTLLEATFNNANNSKEPDIPNEDKKLGMASLQLARTFEEEINKNREGKFLVNRLKINKVLSTLSLALKERNKNDEAAKSYSELLDNIKSYLNLLYKKQSGGFLSQDEVRRNLDAEKNQIVKDLRMYIPKYNLLVARNGSLPDFNADAYHMDRKEFTPYYKSLVKRAYESEKGTLVKKEGGKIAASKEEQAKRAAVYNMKSFPTKIDGVEYKHLSEYVKTIAAKGVKPQGQIILVYRGYGSYQKNKFANPVVIINGEYYKVSYTMFMKGKPAGVCYQGSPYYGYFTKATSDPKYQEFRDFLNSDEYIKNQIAECFFLV